MAIGGEVGLWQGNYRGSVLAIGMKRLKKMCVWKAWVAGNENVTKKCERKYGGCDEEVGSLVV